VNHDGRRVAAAVEDVFSDQPGVLAATHQQVRERSKALTAADSVALEGTESGRGEVTDKKKSGPHWSSVRNEVRTSQPICGPSLLVRNVLQARDALHDSPQPARSAARRGCATDLDSSRALGQAVTDKVAAERTADKVRPSPRRQPC